MARIFTHLIHPLFTLFSPRLWRIQTLVAARLSSLSRSNSHVKYTFSKIKKCDPNKLNSTSLVRTVRPWGCKVERVQAGLLKGRRWVERERCDAQHEHASAASACPGRCSIRRNGSRAKTSKMGDSDRKCLPRRISARPVPRSMSSENATRKLKVIN